MEPESTLNGYIFTDDAHAKMWLSQPFVDLSQVKLERVQVGELKRCPRCAGEGYTQSVKKIDDLSPSEFIAGTP
jgi:hypothetical protein